MEKEALLHQIMQVDFACIDLHLFLNTHPHQTEAISLLGRFGGEAKRLTQEYEQRFGPLSYATAASNSRHFDWINSPWPWHT